MILCAMESILHPWQRVAVPRGSMIEAPPRMPWSTDQAAASRAQSLTEAASGFAASAVPVLDVSIWEPVLANLATITASCSRVTGSFGPKQFVPS